MAYSPKYSSIKYSGKSPEELLETSDWFIEAIQGMRTWNALVEERANKKYRQWEREVTKENYTLSAIDTVVNLAKSQPDDAAVYDDSLKELNRIFENSTVKDPKTSALVTKGRIAKKFLTRERAEIATVQQIFERLNDRNTVFTHENIYNQVNEPGWDPTSGEKSNTEKLLDDAQDWLNDEQSELERMERYDGSIKLEIEKLRKEYEDISFYVGHDGKISKADMTAAKMGQNIKEVYDKKVEESNQFLGAIRKYENDLAKLQVKQQYYYDQSQTDAEEEILSQYRLTPEEVDIMATLPSQIADLNSQLADTQLWIKKNRFDATGQGGQYVDRGDPYGAGNIMSQDRYAQSGRKAPRETVVAKGTASQNIHIPGKSDPAAGKEPLTYKDQEIKDFEYSGIKFLGGPKGIGIEDILSIEDIQEVEEVANIEHFSQVVGSIDFKSGYIYDQSGKRIKSKDGKVARVPSKVLQKYRGKVTEGQIMQTLDNDVKGISIDLRSGDASVAEDSDLSVVLSDEYDFSGKNEQEVKQIKQFANKYKKLIDMYNQKTTDNKKSLLLEKQIRAYDKRLNKLLK